MPTNFDNSHTNQNNQENEVSHLSTIQPKLKSNVESNIKPAHLKKQSADSLPPETKEKMEKSFGKDFSDVKVHKDSKSAKDINAKAFAQGSDIHFAPGEFEPGTEEGQKLIGHELTHVQQQKEGKVEKETPQKKDVSINTDSSLEQEADEMGGKASRGETIGSVTPSSGGIQRVVNETATDYRDYASLKNMTLGDLDLYAKKQADWHASPTLKDAERDEIRSVLMFGRDPEILSGCSGMKVNSLLAQIAIHGLVDLQMNLMLYSKAVSEQDPFELQQLTNVAKAYETGIDLGKLKAAFPGFVLKSAMKEKEFYLLQADKYIDDLITYFTTASPLFAAENGSDFDSYHSMRVIDKVDPLTYYNAPLKGYVKNFHRFEKKALDKLTVNFNDTSKKKPLTLILHTALDHNGAFHRDAHLTKVIKDKKIHTIMVEGKETLDEIKSEIDPLAKKYGINDKLDQVMLAGHGNARLMQLGGTVQDDGSGELEEVNDAVSLDRNKVKTDELFEEILGHMDNDTDPDKQKHRRIIFNACLTNSNSVRNALASPDEAGAKQEIINYINSNASLATYMQNLATSKNKDVKAIGSNASFGSIGLINKKHELDLTSKWDPKLTAPKDIYVRYGTEPSGALRAVLETWARDEDACVKAMKKRVKEGASDWDGIIIKTLYKIILDRYLDQGESIRMLSMLADEIGEFKWDEECRPEKISVMDTLGADSIELFKALKKSSEWKANAYIPLVIYQAWMTADPSDAGVKIAFLETLNKKFTCQSARKYVGIDYLSMNSHMATLLGSKNDGAMKLALLVC